MKSSTLLSGILIGLLSFSFSFSPAQKSSTDFDLLLKFGDVNTVENVGDYLATFQLSQQEVVEGYFYKIIQFYDIPTSADFEMLDQSGLTFLEYVPHKAYIVAIPANYDLASLMEFNVRSIIDIQEEYKQDPYLLDKNYPEWALRGNNQIEIMISYYRNINFDLASMELSHLVSQVIQNDRLSNFQIVRVDIDDLDNIVPQPQVYFVEPVYPEGEPENYTGKTLHRSNVLDSHYETGRHYDGTDVKIMLQDDGIIGPHIDYEGRIGAQNLSNNFGDHGDHCAGILFGSGNLDPTAAGMAPGAELHTWSASNYQGFSNISNAYTETEIRISSTSYGDGCNAGYTSLARTMDIQVHTFTSLMHVFSTGNSGTQNCGYGAGSGWGNITGGHKMGKNVIATANLNLTGNLSGSSSRGPAHDGRIKPDISAKGSSVYSTVDPNDYDTKSGTSMACPGIAGSLAQLYQAYKELNSGDEPPGGMMKGIILNTAEDLGNTGPDFKHGWGQINNLRAVETLEEERYMIESISQGETNAHTIIVPGDVTEMKVMVYWTDKEASVNASVALVNNLDITITDPSSDVHYPWVLNPYPHPDSLNKPAEKGTDELNNMEQVQIDDPAGGSYTLNVEGTEVPFGPQEYYVIYQFRFEEIQVTYPLGGESFDLNEEVLIRWDAHGTDDVFTLEYTLDNGNTWELISNVPGSLRYHYWDTPAEISGQAKIRVSRNGMESMSEDVFSIMSIPENIHVARACEESVLLRWDLLAGAESYDVFVLGEKYMDWVGSTTSDSLFIQDISSEEDQWFSVRAVGPENAIGRRAIAIMKEPGTWDCLVTKDIAVSNVISPPLGILFDCQDFTDLNVQIELTNVAIEDISDITVYYSFNGQPALSETVSETIEAGESMIHTFSSAVSLPATGLYDMEVWIESDADQNDDNNELTGLSELIEGSFMEQYTLVHFDDYTNCSTSSLCEQVSCYIDEQFLNLQNMLNDDIDWRVQSGLTPTNFTGPLGDHTTGTFGRYLYLEASGDCENKKAILTTPCIDLSGNNSPLLTFWYNMNGEEMGSLHVDVISNGILHKDIIAPFEGDLGYDWLEGQAELSSYTGENISIRFRGYTGSGELSDLAIDDILITDVTNIGETEKEDAFNVYPNPSPGIFQLTSNSSYQGEVTLKILDLTGRSVFQTHFDNLRNGETKTLDISAFDGGVYYLILETDLGRFEEKLVVY